MAVVKLDGAKVANPGSARPNLGSSSLVSEQDVQYKLLSIYAHQREDSAPLKTRVHDCLWRWSGGQGEEGREKDKRLRAQSSNGVS